MSIGRWLKAWKSSPAPDAVVGELVAQVSDELPPSGLSNSLAGSVSELEDAYNRLMRRPTYFAGNTVTWCVLAPQICRC